MSTVVLRRATLADVPTLERWDREPHVIAATTDDGNAHTAFGDHDWSVEIPRQSDLDYYLIGEVDGRAIGAMQVIDPREEPTHYWGEIESHLRALDIWIGSASDLGRGYGEQMMRLAIEQCFSNTQVRAIVIDPLASNTRAHKFYARLGFVPVGRQRFGPDGEDDCLVHRLERASWQARAPA